MSFHTRDLPERWVLDLSRIVSNKTGVSQFDILRHSKVPRHVSARRDVMAMAYKEGRKKAEIARALKMDWVTVNIGIQAKKRALGRDMEHMPRREFPNV